MIETLNNNTTPDNNDQGKKYPVLNWAIILYIQLFIHNFIHFWKCYIPKDSQQVKYFPVHKSNKPYKLSWKLLVKMFHNKITYGISPYTNFGKCKWLVFDDDIGDISQTQQYIDIICEELEIPRDRVHVAFSGSKGFHLWLFIHPWIKSSIVVAVGKYLKQVIIERTGISPFKLEIRPENPKNSRCIKAPLSYHKLTGKQSVFVDKNFKPVTDQWEHLKYMSERRITGADLLKYLDKANARNRESV